MHSMPDVNAEVDLDYEIPEDFPKKLESIIGGIKCLQIRILIQLFY
jgi:hypothetical protein